MIMGLKDSKNDGKILFLSYCFVGKCQDYGMLKKDFPPGKGWFKKFKVRVDLGYTGFDKDYEFGQLFLPAKNYARRPLTKDQKRSNREMSRQCVAIEPHRRTDTISRLKRYRVLSDRLRMHDFAKYDDILEVCAGLWNFYLTS